VDAPLGQDHGDLGVRRRRTIRELTEAYAHCADRRDAKGQMALFTADTHFVVYMNAKDSTPSQELHSRHLAVCGALSLRRLDRRTSTVMTPIAPNEAELWRTPALQYRGAVKPA